MATATLDLVIALRDQASAGLSRLSGGVSTLGGHFRDLARTGLVAATGALVGFGAAAGATAISGLRLNSTMEQVHTQLLAFTKDGDKAAQILEDIRARAASTPFAFEEMARATASLLPAANSSGVALMDLVAQAEVLAALNPAEGLEGAAFALKEALGGDFLSIVERFNLPKQRLMELKEQGVPAIEAVRIALQELGADQSLVVGMSQTMEGRWSTLMDTFDTVKGAFTQPIFDLFKRGLEQLQPLLDANMPRFIELAERAGQLVAGGLQELAEWLIPRLVEGFGLFRDSIITFQQALSGNWEDDAIIHPLHRVIGVIGLVIDAFGEGGLKGALDTLMPYVQEAFGALVAYIQEQLPGWLETLKGWGLAAVNWIADAIPPLLAKLGEWALALFSWVQTQLPTWMATIAVWGQQLWQWIVDSTPTVLAKLGEWLTSLLTWLATNLPTWINTLLTWGAELANWIANAIPPMLEKAGQFLAELVRWAIEEVLPALEEQAIEWAIALYSWITDVLIPEIGPKFMEFVAAAITSLKAVQDSLVRVAAEIGAAMIEALINAMLSGAASLGGRLQGALMGGLVGVGYSAGQGAVGAGPSRSVGQPVPKGPGFASGGSFTVPPGFPNDTYPMRVSSGEQVSVTPAGQAAGGGVTIIQNFYGPADRAQVAAAAEEGTVRGNMRSRGMVY